LSPALILLQQTPHVRARSEPDHLGFIGRCSVDEVATTCAAVQPSITDDGTAGFVWLVGAEPASVDAPAIVSWPCSCGELVVSILNDAWADEVHPEHSDPARGDR